MYKNHDNITHVYCDMPALKTGRQMFYGTSLISFSGDLSSLTDGYHMFSKGCRLDSESIINIVDGINNFAKSNDNSHFIGIGYDSSKVSDTFKNEITYEFNSKGWDVFWYKDGDLSKFNKN